MSLRDAAKALVDKLTRVHASREYETVWYTAHLHNGPYQGPTYIDELDALRAALAADAAHPDRWATPAEGEATGCYPCDTCRGFRAIGQPCQVCSAALADRTARVEADRRAAADAAHGGEEPPGEFLHEADCTKPDVQRERHVGYFCATCGAAHWYDPPAAHGGERAKPHPSHRWIETSDPMTAMCSACRVLEGDPLEFNPCAAAPSPLENEEADRLVAPLFADDGERRPIERGCMTCRYSKVLDSVDPCRTCFTVRIAGGEAFTKWVERAPGRSGGKP